jgi:hypothetical protein
MVPVSRLEAVDRTTFSSRAHLYQLLNRDNLANMSGISVWMCFVEGEGGWHVVEITAFET